MTYLSKYGEARTIQIPVIKRGVVDYALGADWTPAAGDVKISKDGGAAANVTNLPTALTMGNTVLWVFSLTTTELQAARVDVTIADAATKAVEDTAFSIETYGHASAQHAFDLDTPATGAADVEADAPMYYPPADATAVPFMFRTKGTVTGFTVSSVKIYKNGGTTERASTSGITVFTDFDGVVNSHCIKIDFTDNSDPGFYEVGSYYNIVLDSITVSGVTWRGPVAAARIMEEENPSGLPLVDLGAINGTPVAPSVAGFLPVDVHYVRGVLAPAANGRLEANMTHTGGNPIQQVGGVLSVNMIQISDDAEAANAAEAMLDGTGGVIITADLNGTVAAVGGVPAFPSNFSSLVIDAGGVVNANIKKINNKAFNTATKPFDVED